MDIRRWFCYIIIKCVFIQCLSGKTISLNELIAAEAQKNKVADKPQLTRRAGSRTSPISVNEIISSETQDSQEPDILPRTKFSDLLKHSSLFKRLASQAKTRRLRSDTLIPRDLQISPLKYRKKFQIKSPLKPKKLKFALKPRRKNQTIKREISENESFKHNYIPLLKSLSMLVDNLISSDESESYEIKKKYKRHRLYSEEQFEVPCNCSSKPSLGIAKSNSPKKTTTPAPSLSADISSDTENFALSTNNDYSPYRPHKIIPVLLSRNTYSRRRDNNGPSKRSSATSDRDFEGNISRDYGAYEHHTGVGENESYAESDENDTDSVTRNDTSSPGYSGRSGKRNYTTNSKNRKENEGITEMETTNDSNRKNKFEIGRDKVESENILREPIRRLRGSVRDDKIIHDEGLLPEPIQTKEIHEKIVLSPTYDGANHKRIVNTSGPFTTEDEKIRPRNETVILIERNSSNYGNYSKNTGKKVPVVIIFDGYSVTRDKNGENKVSGKTIHIRS